MTDPRTRWWSAVTRAARGDYAGAWIDLDALSIDLDRQPALLSLVESTRGSHLRQLGDVVGAREHDTAALDLARAADGAEAGMAEAEARIGLAADAIATGSPGGTALAEVRAAAELATGTSLPASVGPRHRILIRWHWVSAEDGLLRGDADLAHAHAREAIALSGTSAPRHRAKGLIIAAACGRGDAADLLVRADRLIRAGAWDTLAWPLALVAAAARDRGTDLDAIPGLEAIPGGSAGLLARGSRATARIAARLPEPLARAWLGRPDVRSLGAAAGE